MQLGCYHCCREPVYVERDEVRHLLDGVADKTELTAGAERWWAAFFANGLQSISPVEEGLVGLMRYRVARLWCPFLKNGVCSQYARRPSVCRLHLAIGDPIRCAKDKLRSSQRYAMIEERGEVEFHAIGLQCENAPQALFQFDHLGIWLGHFLLGKTERSEGGSDLLVTQGDPR